MVVCDAIARLVTCIKMTGLIFLDTLIWWRPGCRKANIVEQRHLVAAVVVALAMDHDSVDTELSHTDHDSFLNQLS